MYCDGCQVGRGFAKRRSEFWNRHQNEIFFAFGGVLGLGLLATTVDVIVPALQPPSGGPASSGNANSPVNIGIVFTPTVNFSVNDLGFYDTPGVTAGEIVTIFNSSGGMVVQATVPITGGTTAGYFWQSITPVTLTAGDQYTVDAETGNNPWSSGSVPIVNSDLTYDLHDYDYSSSVAFPQNTSGVAANAYFCPDFSIAPIPEPTTVMASALTLLPIGWHLLRRCHKRISLL
jgi:hypothetical protein